MAGDYPNYSSYTNYYSVRTCEVFIDPDEEYPVIKPPKCDYCGDHAPSGDARNIWSGYHNAWYHRFACWVRYGKLDA